MTVCMRVTLLLGDRYLYCQILLISQYKEHRKSFYYLLPFQSLIKDNDGYHNLSGNRIETLKICCRNGLKVIAK